MAGSPAAAADSDSSDEEKVEEAPAPGGPAPEAPAPAAAELPPSTRDKKKKAPPRPGNQEHQIRWDPATGEDKPRNDSRWPMVSRLVRLVRQRGFWKPPTAAELAEGLLDAEIRIRREITNRARAEGEDLEKNVSYGEVLNYWAWFENFVLQFHANGTFAATITGWERFEGDFVAPVPVDLIDSFMEMRARPRGPSNLATRDRVPTSPTAGGAGRGLRGRS